MHSRHRVAAVLAGLAAAALAPAGAAAVAPAIARGTPTAAAARVAADAAGRTAVGARERPGGRRAGGTRRARRLKRLRRTRAHVPAWILRPGPLGSAAPVPGGTAPATDAPPGGGTAPGPGATPPSSSCRYAVGAKEVEWSVQLSRLSVCAGSVTIEAQNYGDDPHDLVLQREGGPELQAWPTLAPGRPGGVEARRLDLSPGRYTLYCSLLGGTPPGTPGESHAAAGMTATLTVSAP